MDGNAAAAKPIPRHIAIGVDERPSLGVSVLSALQHVGLMTIYLIYPVLLANASGASAEVTAAMVSLTLVALAVGTILQVIPFGPCGSGFLCQPIPSVVYLVPSLVALKHGGLPLVFGMTVAAGLFEIALSRLLRYLRPLFLPEIAGLVVLLMGISTGMVGLRAVLGSAHDLALAFAVLALIVAVHVWGSGGWRMFCGLIGMAAGYAAAAALGRIDPEHWAMLSVSAFFEVPGIGHIGWAFDPSLAVPFVIAALAATLKVVGNVTTLQKANNPQWARAEMGSISRGVLADGLGTAVAGVLGTQGLNSSASAVGLASATGVMSRRVAYPIAAILLALAFVPKLGLLLHMMPRSVAGATLVFAAAFIAVNGLQMMTSRLPDARASLISVWRSFLLVAGRL